MCAFVYDRREAWIHIKMLSFSGQKSIEFYKSVYCTFEKQFHYTYIYEICCDKENKYVISRVFRMRNQSEYLYVGRQRKEMNSIYLSWMCVWIVGVFFKANLTHCSPYIILTIYVSSCGRIRFIECPSRKVWCVMRKLVLKGGIHCRVCGASQLSFDVSLCVPMYNINIAHYIVEVESIEMLYTYRKINN